MPESAVDIQDVLELLPHRYPFLLIDRVVDLVPGESATGVKCVSANEPFFQGHFPSRPIMPGVLVLEAMAQTSRRAGGEDARPAPGPDRRVLLRRRQGEVPKAGRAGGHAGAAHSDVAGAAADLAFTGVATVSGAQVADSEFAVMYALKPE